MRQACDSKNYRQVQKTKERNFTEKREEVGRRCFEQKSLGGKREFRVVTLLTG